MPPHAVLLFCGSSCFSFFLLESRLGSLGSQIDVWCFSPQFRHLPFERHWYLVSDIDTLCGLIGGSWGIYFSAPIWSFSLLLILLLSNWCDGVYRRNICMVLAQISHSYRSLLVACVFGAVECLRVRRQLWVRARRRRLSLCRFLA